MAEIFYPSTEKESKPLPGSVKCKEIFSLVFRKDLNRKMIAFSGFVKKRVAKEQRSVIFTDFRVALEGL